ncbi:hypothetical protein EDD18DRAFT_1357418 [Armillaria luteobubalina]|uniref:Uncharacterized protein n=1 Tax=Armillaria luteobubalina TaxID=153913 RepID=A0AA39PYM1_9AGAR|nr:hypothetical protein EDD18DRAFT_1357418 [Armillaria luteobubalina]
MTTAELLTHYEFDDDSALSTSVAPNNVVVPYDPNYPAPPATAIAFNSDLALPCEDEDSFSLSDYSDSEDAEMADDSSSEDTDMELFSDSESSNSYSSVSYDFAPFLGPCKDDTDDEGYGDGISVLTTNGYGDEVDVVMEDHRLLAGHPQPLVSIFYKISYNYRGPSYTEFPITIGKSNSTYPSEPYRIGILLPAPGLPA